MATVSSTSVSQIGLSPTGTGVGAVGRATAHPQGSYYPSPFFDIANTYLPSSIKSLFRYCSYYVATNPIIGATVYKMAEFPVTDLIIEEDKEALKKVWKNILEDHLDIKSMLIENGLNFQTYGNSFISIHFPFKRYLICRKCDAKTFISKIKYEYRNFQFSGICPQCKISGFFRLIDEPIKQVQGINIIFWNPDNIDIEYNQVTGERTYKYSIPGNLRRVIMTGKPRRILNSIPTLFIDAVKNKKHVVFDSEQLYHYKNPSLAGKDMGWGHPVIMNVLKYLYVLQVFIKAREVVGHNYILPLWVLFPQSYNNENPFELLNMDRWQERVTNEILKWRQDCVSPETLIETYDGLKQADKIKKGDLLKTHDGRWAAVEKLWRRPLRPGEKAYQVKLRGLYAYKNIVSENHPFLAAKKLNKGNGHKLGKSEFIRVKNLEKGDYIGYPINRRIIVREYIDLKNYVDRAVTDDWIYIDHTRQGSPEAFEFFHERSDWTFARGERQEYIYNTGCRLNDIKAAQLAIREKRTLRRIPRYLKFDEELAWVVGLYLAEGSCGAKQVQFARHTEETESIQRLKEFFADRFNATCTNIKKEGECFQVTVNSKVATQLFRILCPGTARTKKIPRIYMEAEDHIIIALLNGMWDGDGCWHEDGYSKKLQYTSASVNLAENTRQLLMSLKIPATIIFSKKSGKGGIINNRRIKGKGSYRVYTHSESKIRLLDLFEKKNNPHEIKRSHTGVFRDDIFWHRIDKIIELHVPEVIGIQMDKSEIAVQVEDDIETHGTFCIAGSACGNSGYIPIMPLPLGFQHIGGQGAQLSVVPEIQNITADILAGLRVPREFLFGGLSYTGTSITIRMLENQFINYRNSSIRFLRSFLIPKIAKFLDIKPVRVSFSDLRMADDIQRKQLVANLAAQRRLPWSYLIEEFGKTKEAADALIAKETKYDLEQQVELAKGQAKAQGEAQMVMAKYAYKVQILQEQLIMQAQQDLIDQGMPPEQVKGAVDRIMANGGFDIPPEMMNQLSGEARQEVAAGDKSLPNKQLNFTTFNPDAMIRSWAEQVSNIPDAGLRMKLIDELSGGNQLQAMVAQQALQLLTSTDMRPMPEQKPPRRKTKSV